MSQSLQDQFVQTVFGVDLSQYQVADDDLDAAPPPHDGPPAAASGHAPDGPGANPAANAWTAKAGLLASVGKQIAALEVLGSGAAAGFKTTLAQIKADAAANKFEDATKALDTVAGQVKAEFDKQRAPKAPSADEVKARKEAAKKVTSTAGHGTADDTALVQDQLAKMPKGLLDALDKNGTKVKVCRGSVTDYMTDLKGVQPRGWPAGKTWDSVPGLQRPSSKEVVLATIGHDAGKPHVPNTGEGHGSVNLAIHETAHGVDYAASPHISTTKPFTDARDPDKGALDEYESQPNPAGPEETFAESCARFYSNDPSSAENTPHLHKYWRDNPLATDGGGAAAAGKAGAAGGAAGDAEGGKK